MTRASIVGLLLTALVASSVHAQPVAVSVEEEARLRFEEGTLALREQRYEEAASALRRSLELMPNVANAFNLAVALRGAGQLTAALDILDRLLLDEFGELDEERRPVVGEERRQVRAERPQLVVSVRGVPQAVVAVDGTTVGTVSGAGLVVDVDPGSRTVRVTAEGAEPVERSVEVERGSMERVTMNVVPTPTQTAEQAEPADAALDPEPAEPESPSTGIRAWPFVVGGLAVAALAVGLAIGLQGVRTREPLSDPVTGVGMTLLSY